MNFSVCLILIAAAVLVVSAQQSDIQNGSSRRSRKVRETIRAIQQSSKVNEDASVYPEATRLLRNLFLDGVNYISDSEETMKKGIEAAKKLVSENPKAAQEQFQQTVDNAVMLAFKSGSPLFKASGGALSLSDNGARQGLEMASRLMIEAGLSILDSLNLAGVLFNQGTEAGAKASGDLIETVSFTAAAGYAGSLDNIQKSFRESIEALRNPQSNSRQEQVEQRNCGSAETDPEGANAIKDINEAANNALKRGANADVVRKLRKAFLCSISDLVDITANGQQTVEDLKSIANTNPSAAETTYLKRSEVIKEAIYNLASRLYVLIGESAQKAGKLNNNETGAAINAIETGKVKILLGTKEAGNLIVIALKYPSKVPELGIEAASRTGVFGKTAFIQGLLQGSKLILNVL